MASPIPSTWPPAAREPRLLRPPPRPGSIEDRYRALFLIGRGGMGTVEVAIERAAEGLERVVALKRLLPMGARDPRHKEMFLREARLAALLAHPNVVHAFAFGELHGEPFMAMEYVEGEPLSHVLHTANDLDRRIPPEIVAFVLAEVCDGLHAAHELRDGEGRLLGVVHRDVSPHNVMMAYDGRVKLLDFGVAKFEASGNETRTGEVKGKMAYMSPEQALGEKLDRRSDLFSIGAVLFECLAGRRMWGPGTDFEVMRKLALESPPRLDTALQSPRRALVDLYSRLVARDPEKRPLNAAEVAAELRAFAASGVPAPNVEAVRSLMHVLFGRQALDRRTQLAESLQQAAPSRVEALTLSLDPRLIGAIQSHAEPIVLESPPSVARSIRSLGRLMPAVFVLAGLAALAAAFVVGRNEQTPNVQRRPEAVLASPRAAFAAPVVTALPISTTDTPAPTTAAAAAAADLTSMPTPTSPPPSASAASLRPIRSAPQPIPAGSSVPNVPRLTRPEVSAEAPSAQPTKLPDVDPAPF